MTAQPEVLAGNPQAAIGATETGGDVLSDVLRSVRLSGSLQFCFIPAGDWQTDDRPANIAGRQANAVPFHIVAEGSCWLKIGDSEVSLAAGDIVAFPFASGHQLGVGHGGRLIRPAGDLPPRPWRSMPVLRYGEGPPDLRLLCGYLLCDALDFRPLKEALPPLLHVRTGGDDSVAWLRATIAQIVAEVDRPRSGSLSMLERLTEIAFIEVLRHQIGMMPKGAVGWLAALADPALRKCLSLIHEDPRRDWSLPELAAASGLSRSTLAERFEAMLGTAPIRYLRDWRLCLAATALGSGSAPIAEIAYEAGYGTEAAFSRAFSRAYGIPPGSWRQKARQG